MRALPHTIDDLERVTAANESRRDWRVIRRLVPYLWAHRTRIGIGVACLVLAKVATIAVPVVLKFIIDTLDAARDTAVVSVPLALLVGYGLLRLASGLFQELRSAVFARAAQGTVRRIALEVFRHLHSLSLRFHLDRRTGGISRDLERGSRSTGQLLQYMVFSVLPTFFEVTAVAIFLFVAYDAWFGVITLVSVAIYVWYTYVVTAWRTRFRVRMNMMDSQANTRAVDALINYETVKYFVNEDYEARRYDDDMREWENASVKSQTSLALLNTGQGAIIALGVTAVMLLAAHGVVAGRMSLGDFVLVNAFMLQIYIPLNLLGTTFREIKHCLIDMERMFALLDEPPEIVEKPGAPTLRIRNSDVRFENVGFSYGPDRRILDNVSFTIPSGHKVAVVGPSGAGKSTLARLLFRFYDPTQGRILIDGQDLRDVTLGSLRAAIGIVPQDTVLFNDTLHHNLGYGNPDADEQAIDNAVRLAHLDNFVRALPDGLQTRVGERGLKLSGGEKQRVAIARTLLKDPPILILDEATSALDSHSERAIQTALNAAAANRTTLVIAHRLSTVVDAEEILVLDNGRIEERGSHLELLAQNGLYAAMWRLQREERARGDKPPEHSDTARRAHEPAAPASAR